MLLLSGMAGCRLPAPTERQTYVTTARPYTPTHPPSPTPPAAFAPLPAGLYTLTIQNSLAGDIFIFLDGQYRLRVAAGSSNTYAGLPSGNYTLLYCLQSAMNACAEPIALHLAADMLLTAGDETGGQLTNRLPSPTIPYAPPSANPPASATPTQVAEALPAPAEPTPTSLPSPSLPPAGPPNTQMNAATLTAVAPTLAAMAPTITAAAARIPPTDTPLPDRGEGFMITVHNSSIFPLGVSMDGQFLMSVPPRMYMWFLHIQSGEHTFAFCPGQLPCSHRTINIVEDTEVYISP